MNNVMALVPTERLRQDAEPIAAIYRNLGVQVAEHVVARALAELAQVVQALTTQINQRDLALVPRDLRRLQRLSANMGLVSMAQSAADAHLCLNAKDSTAFAAVWARLQRVAERSFVPITGALDQSV
jgi:hypothetical protein